jgi:YebC/PmpR family DNA-binding regulatory protein
MSGHSKWATIKRKKGALDAKRGKLFTKLIKEITVAARMGGGDVDGNPRLRKAVTDAKAQSMPNDTIKRAIQRGTGEIEGAAYEEIIYEGTGPGGTLFLVEALTDNKNRTVAEIRKVFEKNNGALGAAGSVQWAFERKGVITIGRESATEDQLMEIAVGAGAEDYTDQGEEWQITTPVSELDGVSKALEGAKIAVKTNAPGYVPKSKKPVTGRDAEVCLQLFEALDDHDDVQNVFADFDISDEELAKMEG